MFRIVLLPVSLYISPLAVDGSDRVLPVEKVSIWSCSVCSSLLRAQPLAYRTTVAAVTRKRSICLCHPPTLIEDCNQACCYPIQVYRAGSCVLILPELLGLLPFEPTHPPTRARPAEVRGLGHTVSLNRQMDQRHQRSVNPRVTFHSSGYCETRGGS